jgi:hypothetical protein
LLRRLRDNVCFDLFALFGAVQTPFAALTAGSCLIIPLNQASGTSNVAAISALSKSHRNKLQSVSIG